MKHVHSVFQKLYTYPGNFRAFKALIAAEYSGAKVTVDTNFKFGETNKSAGFLTKFPLGKVSYFTSKRHELMMQHVAITLVFFHN